MCTVAQSMRGTHFYTCSSTNNITFVVSMLFYKMVRDSDKVRAIQRLAPSVQDRKNRPMYMYMFYISHCHSAHSAVTGNGNH